ncbi:MAG TPA: hypothetical protein VME70_10355 [Mycobacteriales bacterium]|nr:hypothetical protein [Mycobacteriales bacterium]
MRLYHQTNNPTAVLPGAPAEYDDVELVLSRTSARSKDADVVIRIELPDADIDRLASHGAGRWITTNAELRRLGAEVDCASEADRERASVYELAVERRKTVQTILRLRQYIDHAEDRPEASRYTLMLRAHQDVLTDLDNAIEEGARRYGVRHLDSYQHQLSA